MGVAGMVLPPRAARALGWSMCTGEGLGWEEVGQGGTQMADCPGPVDGFPQGHRQVNSTWGFSNFNLRTEESPSWGRKDKVGEGILLTCRFWFRRARVEPEILPVS